MFGHGYRLMNAHLVERNIRSANEDAANISVRAAMSNKKELGSTAARMAEVDFEGTLSGRGDLAGRSASTRLDLHYHRQDHRPAPRFAEEVVCGGVAELAAEVAPVLGLMAIGVVGQRIAAGAP